MAKFQPLRTPPYYMENVFKSIIFNYKNKEHKIVINDDNYVNATDVSKIFGRDFYRFRNLKGTEKSISDIIEKYSTEDYILEKNNIIVSTSNCAWVNLTLLETFIKWATKEPLESLYENINKIIEEIEKEIKTKENTKKMFYKDEELIGKLYIDNSFISIRTNGYIKLQDICKLSENKKIENWLKTKENLSYIKTIKDPLLYYIDGIYSKPEVAFKVATWCNIDLVKYHKKYILCDYKERENEEINDEKNLENKLKYDKVLVLNDIQIIMRKKDGYINLTNLCKAGNKDYSEWQYNLSTNEILELNSKILQISKKELIKYENILGNKIIWGHPNIVLEVSRWISLEFGYKINNWIHIENNKLKIVSNSDKFLVLNDIPIIARKEDGYINLTQLCKAGNKEYFHWKENKKTNKFLEVLSNSLNIGKDALIKYDSGSKNERATWGHPQVAINSAQWISPEFDVQVSKWIFELLLTGKVELGKEKSNKELDEIYEEKISKMQNKIDKLTFSNDNLMKEISIVKSENSRIRKNHDKILYKRNYYQFRKGNCLYIIVDSWRSDEYIKFGITSDLNDRLQTYRTIVPECKVLYIIYTDSNNLLEDMIKTKYTDKLTHLNHEYLIDVSFEHLKNTIDMLKLYLNIKFTEETNLSKYNDPYNEEIENVENIEVEEIDKVDKDEIENNNSDNVSIISNFTEMIQSDNEDESENENKVKNDIENINISDEINLMRENENLTKKDKKVKKVEKSKKPKNKKKDKTKKVKTENKNTEIKIMENESEYDKYIEYLNKPNINIGESFEEIYEFNKMYNNLKEAKIKCQFCERKFLDESHLSIHLKKFHEQDIEDNKENKCTICNKKYSDRGKLKRHINTIHEDNQRVKCKLCEKIYKSRDSLISHIRIVHAKLEEVDCEICHKHFVCNASLQTHINNIHQKIEREKFQCNLCDKEFTTKRGLLEHHNMTHDEEYRKKKVTNCEICQKEILIKNLQNHMLRKHKI